MRFLLVVILMSISSNCSAGTETPSDIVRQAILASLKDGDGEFKFFARTLQEAFEKVRDIDACKLTDWWDGNIITGRQNQTGIKILRTDELMNNGSNAEIKATFRDIIEDRLGDKRHQKFVLVKENNNWKISDILFDDSIKKGIDSVGMQDYLRSLVENGCR